MDWEKNEYKTAVWYEIAGIKYNDEKPPPNGPGNTSKSWRFSLYETINTIDIINTISAHLRAIFHSRWRSIT